jgi:group II intron reverse transcriptase/maturase
VFKAVQRKDNNKVRSLQKLIARSNSAKFLAIRKVTQLNEGKKTAGIDGKSSLSLRERFFLKEQLKEVFFWKHNALKSIPIPKKDGSSRILKIPTIKDRAWQCLVKYLMEPAHEALFHERSYGCRPGRSAHDAQKLLFLNLRRGTDGENKRILKIDIEKCFDRISHESIMSRIIAPTKIKSGILRCLKAGTEVLYPNQGTPQGGVISPLLANVVLNGIEEIHRSIRYADDTIFILKATDDVNSITDRINEFLAERGLAVNKKKTELINTKNGFDFLGWHFVVKENGKFKSTPSVENFKNFRKKVKNVINSSNLNTESKVKATAAIVRGWRNYHRFCSMTGRRFSLWDMNHRMFKRLRKGKEFARILVKRAFPTVPFSENKFINVQGRKSPFDGDLIYWAKRASKLYNNVTLKLLKKQNYICSYCGHQLMGEQNVQLHHNDHDHKNWKTQNLSVLHLSCHKNIHANEQHLKKLTLLGV